MKNNAHIEARLIDILNILDARARVEIYLTYEDGSNALLKACKVYELLADSVFLREYKGYDVIGLDIGLYTKILI